MEATPRPWTMEAYPTYVTIKFGQFDIVSGRYSGMGIEQDKADAEFIVKAANAHDRLVEALEEIEVRAQMAQGRDAKLSPESEVYILLDIMRHLQGDARGALALARGKSVRTREPRPGEVDEYLRQEHAAALALARGEGEA